MTSLITNEHFWLHKESKNSSKMFVVGPQGAIEIFNRLVMTYFGIFKGSLLITFSALVRVVAVLRALTG